MVIKVIKVQYLFFMWSLPCAGGEEPCYQTECGVVQERSVKCCDISETGENPSLVELKRQVGLEPIVCGSIRRGWTWKGGFNGSSRTWIFYGGVWFIFSNG